MRKNTTTIPAICLFSEGKMSKNKRRIISVLLLIILSLLFVSGCLKKEEVLEEDLQLIEMLVSIENEDMSIQALILEGPDWQLQNDGSLLECYIKYTHGIHVDHPEYLSDSYDYMDRVLEKRGIVQAFERLNAQEIEQFPEAQREVLVKVIQEGMSIWFYDDGTMKLDSRVESGFQEIRYYSVNLDSVKHLQNVVLEDFVQYWTMGEGVKERENDPSLNEVWQIQQVLENDFETLMK